MPTSLRWTPLHNKRRHRLVTRRSLLPTTAVLGAGHGGMALAAYLAEQRVPVHLWNRSAAPLEAVQARGGIRLDGRLTHPDRVSPDLAYSLKGAEVILVALPASAHREVARACAPYLTDGQVILLLPGRTGGALEFRHELRRAGCTADVTIGEAQTFPFASRVTGAGEASILGVKHRVPVAALPASRTPELLGSCLPLLPMLAPAESVLHTSFENMGAILHPVISLLNAGRIEGDPTGFEFYAEGVTPGVAAVLQAADTERMLIARAYGVEARSLGEWLSDAYGQPGAPLHWAIAGNPAYQGIKAPVTLNHRYLWEDIPTGLVPLAELGAAAGVPCPTLDSFITLASTVHGQAYREGGRTLVSLGLIGLCGQRIRDYVTEGEALMA